MTKPIAIDTGEAWDTFVTTIQDGDSARETVMDVVLTSVADRLGALKALVDGKVALAVENTYTARQSINPIINALLALKVWGEVAFPVAAEGARAATSGILHRETDLTDASTTESPTADAYLVPVIAAARTYTFGSPAGNLGRRIRITRRDTTSAFTATIKDSSSVTIAIMGASAAAWVDIEDESGSGDWHTVAWGGSVTGIA